MGYGSPACIPTPDNFDRVDRNTGLKKSVSGSIKQTSRGSIKSVLARLEGSWGASIHRRHVAKWVECQVGSLRAASGEHSPSGELLHRPNKATGITGSCPGVAGKGRNRTSKGSIVSGVLQPVVRSTEKGKSLASGVGSVQSESICEMRSFQDGDPGGHTSLTPVRRMGNLHRLDRRLFPRADCKDTEEVLSIRSGRNNLPVSGNALWSFSSAESVYGAGEGVETAGFTPGISFEPISRRLDRPESLQDFQCTVNSGSVALDYSDGVSAKLPEIVSSADTSVRLFGVSVRPSEGVSFSNPRTGREDRGFNCPISSGSFTNSSCLSIPDRNAILGHEADSIRTTPFESDSMAYETKLELQELFGSPNRSSPKSDQDAEVVPGSAQFVARYAAASSSAGVSHLHGRISDRMGGPLCTPTSTGHVVCSRQAATHKHTGVQVSDTLSETFCVSDSGEGSVSGFRQCYGCGIFTERRRCSCLGVESSSLAPILVGPKTPDYNSSKAYSGLVECVGRSPIKARSNSTNGVVLMPAGVSKGDSETLDSSHRSICNKRERQVAGLCESDSRPKCLCGGRHEPELDGSGCVCIPSHKSINASVEQGGESAMQDAPSSSFMAGSDLVLGPSPAVRRQTGVTSNKQEASETTSVEYLRQKRGFQESACVVSGHKSLKELGFTDKLVKRIQAPQRKSTRTVYHSKLVQFERWADTEGVDSSNPSIAEVASFFMHLFEQRNLAVGSIQGYRTALSEFMPSVGIRESSEITRLIQSFARDRPKSSRSLVPWDLRVVLDVLSKPPFEPLGKVSLKHLTFKTVFLTALATGRRRGEIRALSRNRLRWSEKEDFIQLFTMPDFLSKNLKATDPVASLRPIVIPSLARHVGSDPNASLNCAVRAIRQYIARTDGFRGERKLLFLGLLPSESEISVNTVSSWLKNTISMCYAVYHDQEGHTIPLEGQVKAHQVRGLASTWAAKGNVAISQIMDACYWKSQNTFTSFYLKDLWVDSDGCFTFGPFVAAQNVVPGVGK